MQRKVARGMESTTLPFLELFCPRPRVPNCIHMPSRKHGWPAPVLPPCCTTAQEDAERCAGRDKNFAFFDTHEAWESAEETFLFGARALLAIDFGSLLT